MGNKIIKTDKFYRSLIVSLCTAALALCNTAGFAVAATSKKNTAPSTLSQQLKVSPVRTNVVVSPGSTGTVKVTVTNLTSSTLTVEPIENDFVAGGEEGQPALILDPNSYAPSHSLKRFMVPLQNITLAPKASEQVTVSLTVPKTAQAGGYFGALRFTPLVAGVSGPSAVALGGSVASLILMTVPGPAVEQLTLTNFDVQQHGDTASNFRTSKDLSLLVRFQNKGNLQEAPFGQIYVQKGKKLLYTYNFNQQDPKAQILPDSARRWSAPLKGMGKFGKYTVGATFSYGTKGQTIEITKTIWIIPTVLIVSALGAILLLAAIVGGLYMFLKSYKRRILRSSRRRY